MRCDLLLTMMRLIWFLHCLLAAFVFTGERNAAQIEHDTILYEKWRDDYAIISRISVLSWRRVRFFAVFVARHL